MKNRNLKEVSVENAIQLTTNNGEVYALMRVYGDTTIDALSYVDSFYTIEPEEETKKTKVDHGRIVALYTANPPRTPKWIAEDMGISVPTVISHLKKEGIYKQEGDRT